MSRFKIHVDQNPDVKDRVLDIRVAPNSVVVSKSLADALAPYALGNDAVTVAGFLTSFPTAVAGSLGVNPSKVYQSAKELVRQLETFGADVTSIQAPAATPPMGARHPGIYGG
ncbi:MAG TPA: hypothetical protein VF647_10420 [Longimicrobium sp.]|jgi:hypothetical protein